MKKFIYTTIALLAIAIGCTKSNIVDVPHGKDNPITFDIYNGKTPVTKATEVTIDNLKTYVKGTDANNPNPEAFHVRAFASESAPLYMDHSVWYKISTPDNPNTEDVNEETGYWDYDGTMYWPISTPLTFIAYRPSMNFSSNSVATYTVGEYASSHSDLIVSDPVKDATAADGVVSLKFKHLLSRIGFKLETVGEGTNVTISDITLHGTFASKGTVNLTAVTPTITGNGETTDHYSFFESGQVFSTAAASEDSKSESVEGNDVYDIYITSSTATGFTANKGNRYMMIIPETVGYLTSGKADEYDVDKDDNTEETIVPYISVTYQLGEAEAQTATLPLIKDVSTTDTPDMRVWNFDKGLAYEFIFRVSISAIEFEGVVVGWDDTTYFPEEEDDEETGNDDNQENGEEGNEPVTE